MSFQELVKFLTQEFVVYIDTPKEERKKKRVERRQQQGNWSQHWFGILPFSLSLLFKRYKKTNRTVRTNKIKA